MESMGATPRIFISYSHDDEAWKGRVVSQLGVLEHEGLLSVWEDRQIAAGDDWLPAIEAAINSCGVALLLISAKFLTSKFILGAEVPALLQRCEQEGVRVIPVILESCAWTRVAWLKSIQARPKDGKPLSGMTKHKASTALATLTEEIADLLARKLPLKDMESQLAKTGSDAKEGAGRNDDQGQNRNDDQSQKDPVKKTPDEKQEILAKAEVSPKPEEEPESETLKKGLEECFQHIAYSLEHERVVFFLGPGINIDPDNSKEESHLPPDDINIASFLAEVCRLNPSDLHKLIGLPCEACPEKIETRPKRAGPSKDVTCPVIVKIEDPKTSKQRQDQLWHDQKLLFARFELRCMSQFKIKEDHGDDEHLFTELSDKLRGDYTFNRVQGFLAQQASKIAKMKNEGQNLSQLMIITTNYDNGLEKAFEKEGLSIDVVYYSTGAKRVSEFYHKLYEINKKEYPYSEDKGEKFDSNYKKIKVYDYCTEIKIPIIIKLHGGVVYQSPEENDTFMIAETHQIDFFQNAKSAFPTDLKSYLDKSNIVFLGYTANDADLRAILHYFFEKKDDPNLFGWHERPNQANKKIPKGWLVTQSPLKAAGEMNDKKYWRHWRVKLIECNCNEFVDLFQDYLKKSSSKLS